MLVIADRHDPQQSHLLTVTGLPAIIVAAALLENDDLLALRLRYNFGGNGHLTGFGDILAFAQPKVHHPASPCHQPRR